ncbi:MAG: lipocalin family protein, partial [Planctomycetia bacterium]
RDSAALRDVSPEAGAFTGTVDCPSVVNSGPNAGTMRATFDGSGGTATFTVTSARLVNVRNRVIAVDYTIDSARKLVMQAVRGFSPQGVELDLAYQEGDEPWNRATPYLSGALTLTQAAARRSDTFIVTAAHEPDVDIQKYAGTWCEQGSVKRSATARLVNTTLVYTPQPDGSVRVWNMGWVGHVSGPKRESFGSAVPVDDTNTRWNVSVSGSSAANPRVNYWIRDFAPDYSWAIVSDAYGGNGRILTRERSVETAVYEDLVRRAAFVGVRTAPITRTPQPGGLG